MGAINWKGDKTKIHPDDLLKRFEELSRLSANLNFFGIAESEEMDALRGEVAGRLHALPVIRRQSENLGHRRLMQAEHDRFFFGK